MKEDGKTDDSSHNEDVPIVLKEQTKSGEEGMEAVNKDPSPSLKQKEHEGDDVPNALIGQSDNSEKKGWKPTTKIPPPPLVIICRTNQHKLIKLRKMDKQWSTQLMEITLSGIGIQVSTSLYNDISSKQIPNMSLM